MQNGDPVKFVKCTKSQYNAMQSKDPATVYFISDDSIAVGSELVSDVTPDDISAFTNDAGYITDIVTDMGQIDLEMEDIEVLDAAQEVLAHYIEVMQTMRGR